MPRLRRYGGGEVKRTVTQIRIDELERFDKVIKDALGELHYDEPSIADLMLLGVRAELARRKRELRRRIKN